MTQSIQPNASVALKPERQSIDHALSRDRGRLLGLLHQLQIKPDDAMLKERFSTLLAASTAARELRQQQIPQVEVDATLPIAEHAEDIIQLIREHQIIVLAGETGSGKTTQLPKLCLAAGRGQAGMIGCTQPRRIAARAVARRVAEELHTSIGDKVGFQVRFAEQVGDNTLIKFMTDGILLAEIASDKWLSRYDTLIIDEAHERSLNIDFLLGYLKQLAKRRPDLKIIVTSATIDTERFSQHFNDAPIVQVEGRSYPVEVRYRPLADDQHMSEGRFDMDSVKTETRSMLDGIVAACDEIQREKSTGDILIFLPGEREIRDAHRVLERRNYRHTEVVPLYARLSARDQDLVFHPGPQRRIVLATNVAETSLTVPRIHYVVDTGLARVKRYSPRQKLDRLQIEPISQASADQRKGRCGRIAPGVCIRLYAEQDFTSRAAYTDPEIRRSALAGVILRMLSLGLATQPRQRPGKGKHKRPQIDHSELVEQFPFIDPPDSRAIADGWQQLIELGAVDTQRMLTSIGTTMAKLPVDVTLARMLIAANQHDCLYAMLAITAFLGIQDPRERPADARGSADAAHAEFADPKSEFIGILNLWEAYRQTSEDSTQSQVRKWCERYFLGFLRMREWRELHRQLKLQCEELGWKIKSTRADSAQPAESTATPWKHVWWTKSGPDARYIALHKALIAGLPTLLGHRHEQGYFEGPRARKFVVFPGSPLASKPPSWLLCAALLETDSWRPRQGAAKEAGVRAWSMTNAAIEPDWVVNEVPHLLSRKYFEPQWLRSQGRVVGREQISLFGLVLIPRKPMYYGGMFPQESREYFLRDALVAGEINTRAAFVARNRAVLAQAENEEAKQRRTGLIVDDSWMMHWYAERIPAQIISAHALDDWYKKLSADQKKTLEWSVEDLLVGDESDAHRFPAYFKLGDVKLPVSYRFEPGAVDDGMTLSVPLHLLNALDPAQLSWLAPGFLQEKATELIRSLPKVQRRNFVPAPDYAKAFVDAYKQEPTALSINEALAQFLKRMSGIELNAADFDEAQLDAHLRMNIRLLESQPNNRSHVLAESRDLDQLRTQFGARAQAAFAALAAEGIAQEQLHTFPDVDIPEQITGAGGVPAFPALHDDIEHVSLRVQAQRARAQREHPQGVRRLLAFELADKLKQARKQLPVQPKTGLLYAAIETGALRAKSTAKPVDDLREDLVSGAFAALTENGLLHVRTRAAFDERKEQIGKQVFAEAMQRLQQAEVILQHVADVREKLDSPLIGWARANLDDMHDQLSALVPPGFLSIVPAHVLSEYPRYLKALSLRAERALNDPSRDQQRMLDIAPFTNAVYDAIEQGYSNDPEWQALRWELEELRVSLFAQELGAKGGVSVKKLAQRLERLRAG